MELFLRNLNPQITENDLKLCLGPLLALDSVQTFQVCKTRTKGCAVLTISDASKAQRFLNRFEHDRRAPHFLVLGKQIQLRTSCKNPDPWLLRVLQKEENDRRLRLDSKDKRYTKIPDARSRSFNLRVSSLSCGRWEIRRSTLQYVVFGNYESHGAVRVDRRSITLALEGKTYPHTKHEILMDFYDIKSIAAMPVAGQTIVTVTLGVAPKVYMHQSESAQDLNSMPAALFLNNNFREPTKYRSRELGILS